MNSNEKYVRSVWVEAQQDGDLSPQRGCSVVLNGRRELGLSFSKTAAWAAAASFTRERLEQVRQLREEISLVESLSRHSGSLIAHACSGETIGHLHLDVKQFARWNRTLARLEAELAKITAGMKPDVQP